MTVRAADAGSLVTVDRRKLCAQLVADLGVTAGLSKELVPDGVLAAKFRTHLDIPGVSKTGTQTTTADSGSGEGCTRELTTR